MTRSAHSLSNSSELETARKSRIPTGWVPATAYILGEFSQFLCIPWRNTGYWCQRGIAHLPLFARELSLQIFLGLVGLILGFLLTTIVLH